MFRNIVTKAPQPFRNPFKPSLQSVEALLRRILPAHIADRLHALHHPDAEASADSAAAAAPGPDQAGGAGASQGFPPRRASLAAVRQRRRQEGNSVGGAGASGSKGRGRAGPEEARTEEEQQVAGLRRGVLWAPRDGWGDPPPKQGKRQLQLVRDWGQLEGAPSVPRLFLDMGSFLVTVMAVFRFSLGCACPLLCTWVAPAAVLSSS